MDKRPLRSKKAKPRSARQYDQQNKGVFGRVCDKVKGTTTWMFSSLSSWIASSQGNQPETCIDSENETVREDNDVVAPSVSHGNKRLRLRFDDDNPSIQSSATQTWLDPPPQNLVYNTIAHTQSSSAQTSILENKESLAVLNGDDHSENSEGSASTSGCSSLVSSHKDINRAVESPFLSLRSELKSRKRKEPSSKSELDDLNSSRTLWSSGFSPSSKFQRRLPTISHTNQPSFNLSTFVGPSKLNESIEKKTSSPFYEGRTAFGGASSLRRMPPSVTPYQVNKTLRNQIKVRESNSEDNLESMSSAAKRILMTLEKMSTPVADAKKIPNSKISPVDLSVYLTPPKCRRNAQFTPTVSSKGPPIANINTIAKLATLKNYGGDRLRQTLPGSPVTSVGKGALDFDNLQSHSSPDTIIQKSGGGKMKNKLNQHHLSSKDPNGGNELLEIPELPNIPLPITKLPTISFGSKLEKPKDSNPPVKNFTFANPIEHDLSLNNAVSTSFAPKPFVFSSPIEHELPINNSLPKEITPLPVSSCAMSGVSSSATWECRACWVQNAVGRTSCIACETPKDPKENHSAFKFKEAKSQPSVSSAVSISTTTAFTFATSVSSSPAFTFGTKTTKSVTPGSFSFKIPDFSPTAWECASCWVRNPEKESKCMACEAPRSKKDNLSTKEPESKSVTINPAKESKLVSESPCSSEVGNKGLKSSSVAEWECESCWVRNPITESQCRACETARVSKDNAEVKSTKSDAFSTWECTSCWVRNPMKEKKCMACETLHPSADKTSGMKDTSGFKFCSPIQNSPIAFKFGNYVCTAPSTATTSSFKFGVAASEPLSTSTTTSSTGFKFGSSSVAATSSFFSSPAFTTDNSQISKQVNANNSSKVGSETVNVNKAGIDKSAEKENNTVNKNTVTESSSDANKDVENEVSSGKTSKKVPEPSGASCEATSVLLVNKSSENEVSDSVITSTPSETLVSKAKEVTTPSVTACFSFTTQPLLDSKKSDTFPFAAPKGKLSSQLVPSQFSGFPSQPSTANKLNTDEKSVQPETKNVNATSENKFPTSFQFTSQSQPVSSAFTALGSTPVFKFGEKSDSSKINSNTASTAVTTSSFSFTNNASNYSSVAVSKGNETSTASETVSLPSTKADDLKVASFSSATTVASSFIFGNAVTTSAPSGGFSFFPSSSTSTAVTSVFTFGVSSNTAQSSKPSGFTFKGVDNTQSITTMSSNAPISSTSQSTVPVLSMGSSATAPAGGFVFGAPKTEAQTTAAAPFTFGSGAVSSSSTPTFSGFQVSAASATTFQFGSQPTGSTASTLGSSGNFTFAKSETPNQVPSSASQNPASAFGSSTTNFVFGGAKTETSNQITSSVTQAPALAFGSTTNFSFSNKTENSNAISQNPNSTFGTSMPSGFANLPALPFAAAGSDKPTFNFGGSSTTGVFQFGAPNNNNNNNNNPERKRTATASGFSFGTPAASETNSSFQPNFNMNTPPSFNFGATSTPAGPAPFQFAASSASKSAAAQNAPRKFKRAVRRVRKD